LILLVSKSTKLETFITSILFLLICMHLDKCVVVNSGSVYTDVFVYCSLLYTNLLVRSVETVGECRSNGFFISFERFVKTVRKGVKFFVFIRSHFSLKTSKTFWRSVKTIWQSVYYPFVIRFFARFNARSLTYVFPWKVTYFNASLAVFDFVVSLSGYKMSFWLLNRIYLALIHLQIHYYFRWILNAVKYQF
jgi:hypothetical protein